MTSHDKPSAEIVDFPAWLLQCEGVRQANKYAGAIGLPNATKLFAVLLLALTTFCGCAQRYKVTFHNRQEITTSSRPKFDKVTKTYHFKDSQGKPVVLPGFRVKEIEPL